MVMSLLPNLTLVISWILGMISVNELVEEKKNDTEVKLEGQDTNIPTIIWLKITVPISQIIISG